MKREEPDLRKFWEDDEQHDDEQHDYEQHDDEQHEDDEQHGGVNCAGFWARAVPVADPDGV